MRDIVQGTSTPAAASPCSDARPGACADDDGSHADADGSHADADDVTVVRRVALLAAPGGFASADVNLTSSVDPARK